MYSKMILLCLIATLVVAQQNINENENILSSNNEQSIGQLNPSSIELNTSLTIPKKIFAIGAIHDRRPSNNGKSVEAYDFQAAKWNIMPPLPSRRFFLGATTLNGKVYAIGGDDGDGFYLQTVDVFDPLTQKWTSAPNMKYKRQSFGVSVLDGKIYVVGGLNDSWFSASRELHIVEMFDGERWTEIGRGMNTKRYGVAVGVLNGNIYAVGGSEGSGAAGSAFAGAVAGHDGKDWLKTVEKMNPATGVWEFVASMNISRFRHSVAVLDGKLYAIGGSNTKFECLKSVEVYDPDLNRWTFVADLNNPRSNAGAVVYGGQIYVVGGDARVSDKLDTTEVFNPQTGTWTILPAKMSSYRWGHGVTLV